MQRSKREVGSTCEADSSNHQSRAIDGRLQGPRGDAPESKVGWDLVLYDAVLLEEVKVAFEDLIGSGVVRVGGGQRQRGPRPGRDDLLALDRPLTQGFASVSDLLRALSLSLRPGSK